MANERTFLAWIRTALALSAGGLGAISLLPDFYGSDGLGIALLALSFVTAASAYRRWTRNETSMRLGEPLPPSRLPRFMAVGTAISIMVTGIVFARYAASDSHIVHPAAARLVGLATVAASGLGLALAVLITLGDATA